MQPEISRFLQALVQAFPAIKPGRENALLYGSILGHNEDEMREKLDEIIDFSELGDFIDEPLRTYSAGMKARLGLAVASAIHPNIFSSTKCWGWATRISKRNRRKKSLHGEGR